MKQKTGRGPTRFLFYDRLDELLGDKPNNSSPHSIDVATSSVSKTSSTGGTDSMKEAEDSDNKVSNSTKRKRSNPSADLLTVKKDYYLKKQCVLEKKQKDVENYLQETIKLKREKLDLYKKKVEVEERKVNAIEHIWKMKDGKEKS